MRPIDYSLYLVLDPELCGGAAGMVETAREAACHGATVVQLRAPGWKKRQWLETAAELKRVLDPLHVPLIVNDHVDVAIACDAAGVHVGQADIPAEVARALVGSGKVVGLSITAVAELSSVPAEGVDYLGVGPVFPTGTKPDATPPMGLPALAEVVASTRLPVVAIGGIHAGNCASLFAAGVEGVAIISAICGQPRVDEATRRVRAAIGEGLRR
jgi:thiamine-phosphate pyrophosphorylase